MSDVSEDEKSPRLRTNPSKKREAGDGSLRSIEVPPVYRLMSSDNTGAQVIGCALNGDNYQTWSRAMLIVPQARNKLPFIDGSLDKPGEDDPLREWWERCNSTILAYAVDAKNLWDDLKERWLHQLVYFVIIKLHYISQLIMFFNSERSTLRSIVILFVNISRQDL
ncbi:hypothetical protein CRG98_031094 [Punica granatum]|uniref:Retrotransposon Copia-like N-terminal domain-containing protein n=1 Tax=Punica granatum TaxID=22663 RepID=A0A2I0IWT0_PUNGR|nr:hypothetical protein CRG98_031094 [Punica granatum]